MTYEVQTCTICQGWINCWTEDNKPMTFATEAEAQAEIDDFLNDIAAEIASGDRAQDEGYDPSEFRIVKVADGVGSEKTAITFTLTIDAQEMRVEYTPNRFSSFPVGHFQFFSPHEPRRRIPVSETCYRSHFAPMPEIEAAPSPQEYAHALALAFIHAGSATQTDEDEAEEGDQLGLF